jgi:hypothetical protein
MHASPGKRWNPLRWFRCLQTTPGEEAATSAPADQNAQLLEGCVQRLQQLIDASAARCELADFGTRNTPPMEPTIVAGAPADQNAQLVLIERVEQLIDASAARCKLDPLVAGATAEQKALLMLIERVEVLESRAHEAETAVREARRLQLFDAYEACCSSHHLTRDLHMFLLGVPACDAAAARKTGREEVVRICEERARGLACLPARLREVLEAQGIDPIWSSPAEFVACNVRLALDVLGLEEAERFWTWRLQTTCHLPANCMPACR